MSRIRSRDTTPEMRVRSLLHRMGYRFRLHVRIPVTNSPPRRGDAESGRAKPLRRNGKAAQQRRPTRGVSVDILLPKHKTAIFVHGCFWHRHAGCKNCTTPTNRRE
jgi:DNA mismatch endonuclease, patch repair protein